MITTQTLCAAQLTWNDYEAIVLKNNSTLLQQGIEVTSSIKTRDIADAARWPTAKLSASASRSDNNSFGTQMSAQYKLFDAGATDAKIKSADSGITLARLTQLKTLYAVRTQARQAYIDSAYYQQRILLLQKILERIQNNERFLLVKYQGGQEAQWVYLRARNNALQTEATIKSAKRYLEEAYLNMNTIAGLKIIEDGVTFESVTVSPSARYVSLEIDAYVSQNIDVLCAQVSYEKSIYDLSAAKAAFWPQANANASLGMSSDTIDFQNSNRSWSVGLGLSYDLFDADVKKNTEEKAKLAQMKAQLAVTLARLEAAYTVVHAKNVYVNTLEQIPIATDSETVALERLKTVEQLYVTGRATYIDWDSAEQQLTQAQNGTLDSYYQAHNALAQFEGACNYFERSMP